MCVCVCVRACVRVCVCMCECVPGYSLKVRIAMITSNGVRKSEWKWSYVVVAKECDCQLNVNSLLCSYQEKIMPLHTHHNVLARYRNIKLWSIIWDESLSRSTLND